jgi:hypothetical protein
MVEQVITSYLEQGFHQLLQAKSCSAGIPLSKHHAEAQEHASRRHTKSLNTPFHIEKAQPADCTSREFRCRSCTDDRNAKEPTESDVYREESSQESF